MAEKDSGSEGKGITVIRKKKKGGGHGGHHGGAWKVAYADFVTAMMAFFMVMWLMGSDEETKLAIEAYFQGKSIEEAGHYGKSSSSGASGSLQTESEQGRFSHKDSDTPSYANPHSIEEQEVIKDLSDLYEGSGFSKDTDYNFVKLDLPQKIIFAEKSVEIPDDLQTRKILNRLAEVFKVHNGLVMIEGFADGAQDWPLAFGRAMAMRRYFIQEHNVNPDKLVPMAGFRPQENAPIPNVELVYKRAVRFTLKRIRPKE